jgi:glucosamine--fructose-6-phosphate aminotransferase (isomerizing)
MYKEILEQPQAMRNVLAGRLREKGGVVFGGFTSSIETSLRKARRILLAGCGTSLFSAMTAKQHIESLAGVLCEVEQAAELYYRDPMLTFRDVFVGISQSGETADTLKSLELAKERHALCLAITNRVGSTLSRGVRAGIYLHAGPEVAVASTKAFTAQAVALLLLSIRLAELRNRDVPPQLRMQLLQLPSLLTATLAQEHVVKEWAAKYVAAPRVIVIGRGSGVALALEAALKLRECAYMDAHGLSAAELKHGTLALVEKGIPVFSVQPSGVLRSKMASNIKEIEARGGEVILLEPPAGLCDELVPIVLAPLMQLFAYHVGVLRGIDVDKPRNLAKAVSVE